MAEILVLKVGSTGLATEHASGSDSVTFASFTVTGGGPVLGANLDMNTGTVSDATSYAVTSPSSQGLVTTVSTPLAFDNIVRKEGANVFTTAGDILFPAIADSAGEVDAFRLPARAGVPSATPTNSGEGYLVWDSSGDMLYAWNGSAWTSAITTAVSAQNVDNTYIADENLAARDVLYISAADNVSKADASAESTARAIGFNVSGAVSDTGSVSVRSKGLLGGFSGLTAGARYYLSETAGAITATVPTTSAAGIVQVGYAKNTTTIDIAIQPLAIRA